MKPFKIHKSKDGRYYNTYKSYNSKVTVDSQMMDKKESVIKNIQSQIITTGRIFGLNKSNNAIIRSFSSKSFKTIESFTQDLTIKK